MEWISVKDRLPELDQFKSSDEVLVYSFVQYEEGEDLYYSIGIGWLAHDGWHTSLDCFNVSPKETITHWMPLPEKP